VISKSGSLSYEVCYRLSNAGIGQSTVVGVGGDPIKGLSIGEALDLFDADTETVATLVLGEIGGFEEYQVCHYAVRQGSKPVGAFLVGRTAPPGRRLGHAGALIGGAGEDYTSKVEALWAAGVHVATTIDQITEVANHLLNITQEEEHGR
jgi:succinyl-CoA synthetase alpha subunit